MLKLLNKISRVLKKRIWHIRNQLKGIEALVVGAPAERKGRVALSPAPIVHLELLAIRVTSNQYYLFGW